MIVTVDIKFWAIALALASAIASCAVIARRPSGTIAQTLATIFAGTVMGPLMPILGIVFLPFILNDLWKDTVETKEAKKT
jgi:hypothetical protein